jgi:hypothetical protein
MSCKFVRLSRSFQWSKGGNQICKTEPLKEAHKISGQSIVSHVGPLFDIWLNLNFNQPNNADLKKNSSPVILEFYLVFTYFSLFLFFFQKMNLWTVIEPFGPIWTYFIKFKIKCIKWSKFEIKFSPDLLEFLLDFLVFFLNFLWVSKFSKSKQWFGPVYRFGHERIISQNRPTFVTLGVPPT